MITGMTLRAHLTRASSLALVGALLSFVLPASPARAAATCTVTQGVHFSSVATLSTLLSNGGTGGVGTCPATAAGDSLVVVFTTGLTMTSVTGGLGYYNAANIEFKSADPVNPATLDGSDQVNPVLLQDKFWLTPAQDVGDGTFTSIIVTNGSNSAISAPNNASRNTDITVTNSTVSSSTGSNGAGLYVSGALTMSGSLVTSNVASSSGGGIYVGGALDLTNTRIIGNTATASAGGGFRASSTVSITGSAITGNTAATNGGGIYAPSALTMVNSTVAANTSSNGAGGAEVATGSVITNSTISGNSGTNAVGGIRSSGTLELNFSTISGNTGTTSKGNLDVTGVLSGIGSVVVGASDGTRSCTVGTKSLTYSVSNDANCVDPLGTGNYATSTSAAIALSALADNSSLRTPVTQTMMPDSGTAGTSGSVAINWVPAGPSAKTALGCASSTCYDQRGVARTGTYFWAGAAQGATPAPVITTFSPSSLAPNASGTVTINGRNLNGITALSLDNGSALTVNQVSVTSATASFGPKSAGAYPISLTTAGGSTTAYFPFTSSAAAPSFTASSPPSSAFAGQAYPSYTFVASGSPSPVYSVSSGSLPTGLSLSSAGVLSGTPTVAALYTFTVIAQNGVMPNATTSTVTITINAPSTTSSLSALSTSAGSLSPSFITSTTAYTSTMISTGGTVTVTPTVTDPTATVTVNGVSATSGSASNPIAVTTGSQAISIVVTAQDGITQTTYTVTVVVTDPTGPPPPWYQSYALLSGHTCDTEWGPSWADWAVPYSGGAVCNRVVFFSGGQWWVQAGFDFLTRNAGTRLWS